MKKIIFSLLFLSVLSFQSCSKDDEQIPEEEKDSFVYYKGSYNFDGSSVGHASVNLLINDDSTAVFYYIGTFNPDFDTTTSENYRVSFRKEQDFYVTNSDKSLYHQFKVEENGDQIKGVFYMDGSNIPSFDELRFLLILNKVKD